MQKIRSHNKRSRTAAASLCVVAAALVGHVACHSTDSAVVSTPAALASSLAADLDDDRPLVLIIDVDNTLYDEAYLRATTGRGIEQQIVENTHKWCAEKLNLSSQQADDLYRSHGSTIEGLRSRLSDEEMKQYYEEVYKPIDVSCLYECQSREWRDTTGYSHSSAEEALPMSGSDLCSYLNNLPCPVYLASNSPSWHVHKVLAALGLSRLRWTGMLTPDLRTDGDLMFPTKAHPQIFYKRVLKAHPKSRVVLLDDSITNVRAAQKLGMQAVHVSNSVSLEDALNVALRHVDARYEFSDIDYLRAKNQVDTKSIHVPTWNTMMKHVRKMMLDYNERSLCIVDVGAGVLSMLELLLKGSGELSPLLAELLEDDTIDRIEYHAYEPNCGLLEACRETLAILGFQSLEKSDEELVFVHSSIPVTVHLHMHDFTARDHDSDQLPPQPHLIVGCCFADLLDPEQLAQDVLSFVSHCSPSRYSSDTLVYFPITFSGTTQFWPPNGFKYRKSRKIPSDTVAFRLYAKALTQKHGHNLDPTRLIQSLQNHGASMLAKGPSHWWIDPIDNEHLWKTMLYFFGATAAPELLRHRYDSTGWIRRSQREQAKIHVTNVDLLFLLPSVTGLSEIGEGIKPKVDDAGFIEEVQFTAPDQVTTIRKPYVRTRDIKPSQVEITSVASLISSGTELKIFKGLFDNAALDVNIKGMREEQMAYPLAYGYSLVGRVTACGSEVKDSEKLLGKMVFCFSPHASHALVDRDAIHVVPDGIDPEDAIFMPSVETALSLVHDAHVRPGEKVAVYGQGLIGLLVTAILRLHNPSADEIAPITTFDAVPDRLAMSAAMGSSQALIPLTPVRLQFFELTTELAGPFDLAIEVSGNAKALQSAIDNTRSGGRIIVGSWYGNRDVNLKLGIDFHRSHKKIQTSQVSEIPAELGGLWTKERRFGVTWDLVKKLRPSRLVTRTATLDEVQSAYEALDTGREIAVSFVYNQA